MDPKPLTSNFTQNEEIKQKKEKNNNGHSKKLSVIGGNAFESNISYKMTYKFFIEDINTNAKSAEKNFNTQQKIDIDEIKKDILDKLSPNQNLTIEQNKKAYEERLEYNSHGKNITVKIKDTNGDNLENENLEYYAQNYNTIFFVFNIDKRNTFYNLEDSLNFMKIKKINKYLLGYNNTSSENIYHDFDYQKEAQKFVEKYGCEFEYFSIEDIYKVKAIILDNISKYLKNISK